VLEACETGGKALISLLYASDFYPPDTTERLFGQFLYAHSGEKGMKKDRGCWTSARRCRTKKSAANLPEG
jgi:hypothetical protein